MSSVTILGEKVRAARLAKRMSMKELADAAQAKARAGDGEFVSLATIKRIESTSEYPGRDRIARGISKVLDVPKSTITRD